MKAIKILSGLLVAVVGLFLTSKVDAATIKGANLSLGDAYAGATTTHTFVFTHITGATLHGVKFMYCTRASTATDGTPGGCDAPGVTTTSPSEGSMTGLTAADWSPTGTAGIINYGQNAGGELIGSNVPMSLEFGNITNNTISPGGSSQCLKSANDSSATCYVRFVSYSNAGLSTEVDTGTFSYTVIDAVTVTARVDPSFTFTLDGVAASTANNGITTSVSSAFNTLPFGNLAANTPKYAAHSLKVTTNTTSGYTVTAKLSTAMTGVYATNNIDPFVAAWATATSWTDPTGTAPNVETGWFGVNTSDTTGATKPSASAVFAGLAGTAQIVKDLGTSDNGSTATIVSYVVGTNVFQPADSYTGTLYYNALPTY